jgi:ATP-binding cassette subfamily F protein uup
MCRAIVSRPDFLMLDEPTNHLDPESIDWVAEFLENFSGTFLVVTHDRYFLDRVTGLIVELANGTFYSYEGNYTDYLVAKLSARRRRTHRAQAPDVSAARVGMGPPRSQRAPDQIQEPSRSIPRNRRAIRAANRRGSRTYHSAATTIGQPRRRTDQPRNGTWRTDALSRIQLHLRNGQRIGVAGRNGLGKTTLLKIIIGELPPTEGAVKIGQLTRFNYVDQGRLRLREDRTVYEEVADGAEVVPFGENKLSVRAYLKRFLFTDDRINTQVKFLSGGERSRLLLARVLKKGGNFLILDEPTNDLDLPTLRVLEEALIAFPGVVLVVSHDRYFLNRVCTGILAFEGGGRIVHSVGNYDYYLEKKQRPLITATRASAAESASKKPAVPSRDAAMRPSRPRKLTWKEARELDGMEAQLQDAEANIVRLEALFATPDFHRTHGAQTGQIVAELAAAKENLTRLYARWEELESIKAGNEQA